MIWFSYYNYAQTTCTHWLVSWNTIEQFMVKHNGANWEPCTLSIETDKLNITE